MGINKSRRDILKIISATMLAPMISGCNFPESNQEPTNTFSADSPNSKFESTQSSQTLQTKTPTQVTQESPTKSSSPSSTGTQLNKLLPEPPQGWNLEDTTRGLFYGIGGKRGVRGIYTSTDGTKFHVVIGLFDQKDSDWLQKRAQTHACEVGWQIVVPYGRYLFMSSTCTNKQTFTPETPAIINDSTPIPNTEKRVRKLLEKSPRLTNTIIEENHVICD